MMSPTEPPSLAALRKHLGKIDKLDDVSRITSLRSLAVDVQATLQAIADDLTYELTQIDSNATVAARLGISVKGVEMAITRYRRRHPDLPRTRRDKDTA
jgi:uncharacterized membrane protein